MMAAPVGRPLAPATHRLEARVRATEDVIFAGYVRAHASRIHLAVSADRPDIVAQSAGELAVLAERRLRQLGGI